MKNLTQEKIFKMIEHIEELCYNQCYMEGQNEDVPGEPFLKRDKPPNSPEVVSKIKIDLIYNLTLSLLLKVYGEMNEHFTNFQSQFSDYNFNEKSLDYYDIISLCLAKLEFVRSEIHLGILNTLKNEVTAEVISDFLLLARTAIDEDNKEVAAVLCCASLEDSLKRLARSNDLIVEGKPMSEVVNSLKSKGLISSTQGNILKSYTQIRNRAFHADWEKIEKVDIGSIIGFTEQFIIENFQ